MGEGVDLAWRLSMSGLAFGQAAWRSQPDRAKQVSDVPR